MRTIKPKQILAFSLLTLLSICISLTITYQINIPTSNDFIYFVTFTIIFYTTLIIIYRIFIYINPMPIGEKPENSKEEFIYHIHLLFYITFFNILILTNATPVVFRRLMYILLGAKIGKNTHPVGIIYDPPLTTIGDNCIIGDGSKLISHVLDTSNEVSHYPISIGNNVTIGTNSTILAGCKIGNNTIIAAHSLVPKHTIIGDNELWMGCPAKITKYLTSK